MSRGESVCILIFEEHASEAVLLANLPGEPGHQLQTDLASEPGKQEMALVASNPGIRTCGARETSPAIEGEIA